MYSQGSDPEPRLSEFQTQVDRLVLALHQWRQSQEQLQPMERQLSQLTRECGAILDRLRQLEASVHRDVTELSFELQSVGNEGRRVAEHRPRSIGGDDARMDDRVGPVEGGVQEAAALSKRVEMRERAAGSERDEVKEAVERAIGEIDARMDDRVRPVEGGMQEAAALSKRVETLERAASGERDEVKEAVERVERGYFRWRLVLASVALGLAGLGGLAFWHLNARLSEASIRAGAAERQAEMAMDSAKRQIAATEQQVERSIAEARQAATNAEAIGDVLSAPDLVRYTLTGGEAGARMFGVLLWSRSHGLIFSGSNLPAAPPNATYQLWLLTSGTPVGAVVFSPDPAGRVTWATDHPPAVPRPVIGAEVTVEPIGGSVVPSGPVFLTRAP